MIKVVSFKICPFVQRVTALLAAKNIPYDIEYIDINNKPQWFLDISPNAQVPVLITESGTPLFESDAIVEYLEEAFKPLEDQVSPEQKALDRAWSYLGSKNYLTQCSAMRSPDKATLQARVNKLRPAFDKVEQAITEGPYFKGEALSNVDIAWLPLLHRAYVLEQQCSYDLLAEHPRLKQWQKSLMETGLSRKSVADDFVTAFTRFYLSDRTYLGAGSDCEYNSSNQCGGSKCCA